MPPDNNSTGFRARKTARFRRAGLQTRPLARLRGFTVHYRCAPSLFAEVEAAGIFGSL
jgi:hypothetical protein